MSKDIKELNVEITKLKKHNADLRKHNAKLEAENKEWYNKALKNLIAFQDKNAECERLKQELADFKAKVQEARELLAELEHKQWEEWSKSVTSQVMDNKISAYEIGIAFQEKHLKWLPNWKPYDELDEKTKDFDRVWADKVIALLLGSGKEQGK